ncbi:Uncharacterized protein APZ42_006187 [Daphnia magna]|uniref:Uncharacterized protein n=1 Tax=Daphnia magna TaxID=35525 RepID=A0A164G1I8_9CRUS|nr:Uncharacterized protein APZ42_006187 [Daphnia magna]
MQKKCPVPLDPWVRKNNPGRVMSRVIIGSNSLFFSSFQSRHQTQPLQRLYLENFFFCQ